MGRKLVAMANTRLRESVLDVGIFLSPVEGTKNQLLAIDWLVNYYNQCELYSDMTWQARGVNVFSRAKKEASTAQAHASLKSYSSYSV